MEHFPAGETESATDQRDRLPRMAKSMDKADVHQSGLDGKEIRIQGARKA